LKAPRNRGFFIFAEDAVEEGVTGLSGEVFALTDEQIVGLGPEEDDRREASSKERDAGRREDGADAARSHTGAQSGEIPRSADLRQQAGSARNDMTTEVPQWLAERMSDPRHVEAAKEFWDGKQRAEKEAAAYREVFATPEDARALKEIYPRGASEARAAAERARALDEIDSAYYRGDAAARTQLAQRMMAQNPNAFREMVEAGMRLLNGNVAQDVTRDPRSVAREEVGNVAAGERPGARETQKVETANHPEAGTRETEHESRIPAEAVRAYGEFERSANAELEKTVGGAIARAMEQALPNLRSMKVSAQADGTGAAPLQERLTTAVREEVEAGLKSDRQLGEQVAKLLSGRRFDRESRAQVVRLIDARAQQLVPGAVRHVVSAWTQTTLAAHGKEEPAARAAAADTSRRSVQVSARENAEQRSTSRREAPVNRGRRVDYGRMSDEEIVGL
jgi:hypothetical protein